MFNIFLIPVSISFTEESFPECDIEVDHLVVNEGGISRFWQLGLRKHIYLIMVDYPGTTKELCCLLRFIGYDILLHAESLSSALRYSHRMPEMCTKIYEDTVRFAALGNNYTQ